MRFESRAIQSWAAPVATMAIVSIAISFTFPLFALLLERMNVTGSLVGLNHTIAAGAMVVAAPILPALLTRTGTVALALCAILIMAAATAAIPLFANYWWWAFLRILLGFAIATLFYVSEYWLVAQAPGANRGKIIAVYSVILSGGYMIGPALLAWLGPENRLTFLLPTLAILAGAIPVLAARRAAPAWESVERRRPFAVLRLLRTDPMLMWGIVLFGVIEFGAMGLIANWGIRSGHDETSSVQFIFWLAAGSMALQLPIGWLADRLDRRHLLAVAGAVSVVMPLIAAAVADSVHGVATAVFLWGGVAAGMYTLALVELGARYRGAELAEANGAAVLAYGLGALLAPLALGWAMDAVPPNGLLYLAALCAAAYCALAVQRLRRTIRTRS